ncbi:MAG: hypothetical protein IPP40_12915 [bacterium]|nr:hypothetical protein [bacterium]
MKHGTILSILLFALCANSQTQFSPGDWQSWRDFRGARALDANMRELFVATGGGVLVYELNRNRWENPAVMGYGSFEAVPIDDALLLLHDERFNYLWVVTRDRLLKWNRGLDRWEIARTNIWPLDERPVNIGIGDQSLYVETIPDRLFDGLFTTGTPIPDPIWMRYIRRYSGDRATGNLFPEMKPGDNDTLSIRWRGLRTKIPLRDSNYPSGVLGQPPAGLPMLFPPPPYTWLADGTLLDQKNRAYPMTDWLVDSWDTFWSTHWGAGVLRTELRGLRGIQELAGPAGNDIRALVLLDNEMWAAGANEGDFMGISVMEDYGDNWRFIEKRDNQQIRSTRVEDMDFVGERVWLASADGLLSYLPRKKIWKRYDVQDNLPSQQVTALAGLRDELWIGTNDGLAVMDTKSNGITRIPNTTFELQGITELLADDSVIWVGTGLGLFQVQVRSHEISQIPMDNGMLVGQVTGLAKFGSTLWVSSPNGIMRRTASGESKSWLADTWMKQTEPTCITASDPYIWIGTDGGLFRFDPSRESWEHYTRRDGLVDDRVQVVREDRGDLWIGTAGGLTRYYYSKPGAPR